LDNLKCKAMAYAEWAEGKIPPLQGATIKPIKVDKEVILKFKGTVIKGCTRIFEVNIPEPYSQLAYHAGLGAKTSSGYGVMDIAKMDKMERRPERWMNVFQSEMNERENKV